MTQIDAVALIKCADVGSNAGEANEWGLVLRVGSIGALHKRAEDVAKKKRKRV